MNPRRSIAVLSTVAALVFGALPAVSVAATHHAAHAASSSSAHDAYCGQGCNIIPPDNDGAGPPTQVTTTASSGSSLPFTGLDLGLLVVAAVGLIAGGTVLRLRLRQGEQE